MFRSAVVVGGALPELVSMLGSEQTRRQALAAEVIHTLAIDDPTSDADNFHSLEICQSGAVAPPAAMLSSPADAAQAAATGALSCLAENPVCQQMIAGAGALAPLMKLTQYGSDMGKLSAMGALDVLTVNNPLVQQELLTAGAPKLLSGLESMGAQLLREQAGSFGARLRDEKAAAAAPKLDEAAHVRAARDTRIKYDGLRQRAVRMMQGWGDERSTHRSGR